MFAVAILLHYQYESEKMEQVHRFNVAGRLNYLLVTLNMLQLPEMISDSSALDRFEFTKTQSF